MSCWWVGGVAGTAVVAAVQRGHVVRIHNVIRMRWRISVVNNRILYVSRVRGS